MLVRKTTEEDIESIRALEEVVEPDLAASERTLLERLHMFPDGFYVAEECGKIVGYVESCLWDKRDFKTFDQIKEFTKHHDETGKTLYVIFMAVAPSYQRRGIASELIRTVVNLAESLGRERVQLVAKDGLYSFYAKRGFNHVRDIPSYLPGMTGVLMERPVGVASVKSVATAPSSR